MSFASGAAGEEDAPDEKAHTRMWIKYYCDDCKAWETRELFEAKKMDVLGSTGAAGGAGGPSSALWSWGCSKVIHYGSFQAIRVAQLNKADGRDSPAQCAFSDTILPSAEPAGQEQQAEVPAQEQAHSRASHADEGVSVRQSPRAAHSNGSLRSSKRPRRHILLSNVHSSLPEAASPNSQGAVTSSSRHAERDGNNGASQLPQVETVENGSEEGDGAVKSAGTENPAVIDAERHENGIVKRPRRLTAGDRGFAQALEFEKESRATTPRTPAKANVVKPVEATPAATARPKRLSAGLKGLVLSVENSKSASSPRVVMGETKKENITPREQAESPISPLKRATRRNRKLGELY